MTEATAETAAESVHRYSPIQRELILKAVNDEKAKGGTWADCLAVAKQAGYRGESQSSLISWVNAAKAAAVRDDTKAANNPEPKRGRGRPKKAAAPVAEAPAVKRGRGRPPGAPNRSRSRKTSTDSTGDLAALLRRCEHDCKILAARAAIKELKAHLAELEAK